MTRKERMDYLLARLPEEKKEEFMSEFRGAVSDEARSDVVKKYCTVYAPGIMDDCIEDLVELSMDDLDAVPAENGNTTKRAFSFVPAIADDRIS